MLAYLLAFVLLSPPLTPTYSSCFEAYLSALIQTNVQEAHGLITHEQARSRRLAAAAAYGDCKREAFRAWLKTHHASLALLRYGFTFSKSSVSETLLHEPLEVVQGRLVEEAVPN